MEKRIDDYLHLYLGCDLYALPINDGEKAGIFMLTPDKLMNILNGGIWSTTKPILRPLSDMSEQEQFQVDTLYEDMLQPGANTDRDFEIEVHAGITMYLLSKHFDLFGLIEAGIAIDKTKLNEVGTAQASVATGDDSSTSAGSTKENK